MEERQTLSEDKKYCWSCGSVIKQEAEVCTNCGVRVGRGTARSGKTGSGWLIAGGVLGVVAGVFALGPGIAMVVDGFTDNGQTPDWVQIGFGISFLVAGILAIVGSLFAITRRSFGLALMGGVCSIWPMWFLGIPALILIAISSGQFYPMGVITPSEISDQEAGKGEGEMENKYGWTGIAIASMWVAVLFVGIYGPAFEVRAAAGDEVTIPTVWALALFALIGSIIIGIFGFRK